jgi:hypothetical protein
MGSTSDGYRMHKQLQYVKQIVTMSDKMKLQQTMKVSGDVMYLCIYFTTFRFILLPPSSGLISPRAVH